METLRPVAMIFSVMCDSPHCLSLLFVVVLYASDSRCVFYSDFLLLSTCPDSLIHSLTLPVLTVPDHLTEIATLLSLIMIVKFDSRRSFGASLWTSVLPGEISLGTFFMKHGLACRPRGSEWWNCLDGTCFRCVCLCVASLILLINLVFVKKDLSLYCEMHI